MSDEHRIAEATLLAKQLVAMYVEMVDRMPIDTIHQVLGGYIYSAINAAKQNAQDPLFGLLK